jgi:hypothetical protein
MLARIQKLGRDGEDRCLDTTADLHSRMLEVEPNLYMLLIDSVDMTRTQRAS